MANFSTTTKDDKVLNLPMYTKNLIEKNQVSFLILVLSMIIRP